MRALTEMVVFIGGVCTIAKFTIDHIRSRKRQKLTPKEHNELQRELQENLDALDDYRERVEKSNRREN